MVFHDATLLNLAMLQPTTGEELRAVSGIGEQKAAKYGQAVLDTISEWKAEHESGGRAYLGGETGQLPKSKAAAQLQPVLRLCPEQLARYVCVPEGISITAFARRLSELKDADQPGALTGRQISDQLTEAGYLIKQLTETDRLLRRPSPAGEAVGIVLTERTKENGETFTMVTLTEKAQRWLIERLSEQSNAEG